MKLEELCNFLTQTSFVQAGFSFSFRQPQQFLSLQSQFTSISSPCEVCAWMQGHLTMKEQLQGREEQISSVFTESWLQTVKIDMKMQRRNGWKKLLDKVITSMHLKKKKQTNGVIRSNDFRKRTGTRQDKYHLQGKKLSMSVTPLSTPLSFYQFLSSRELISLQLLKQSNHKSNSRKMITCWTPWRPLGWVWWHLNYA